MHHLPNIKLHLEPQILLKGCVGLCSSYVNDVAPPVKQIFLCFEGSACQQVVLSANSRCDCMHCCVFFWKSFHKHSTYKRAGKASSGPTALMKHQEASNAVNDMLSGAALTGSVLEEPESTLKVLLWHWPDTAVSLCREWQMKRWWREICDGSKTPSDERDTDSRKQQETEGGCEREDTGRTNQYVKVNTKTTVFVNRY